MASDVCRSFQSHRFFPKPTSLRFYSIAVVYRTDWAGRHLSSSYHGHTMAASQPSLSTYELCSQSLDSDLSDVERQVIRSFFSRIAVMIIWCHVLITTYRDLTPHANYIIAQTKSHPPMYRQFSRRDQRQRRYILPDIRCIPRVLYADWFCHVMRRICPY